ncbi:DUF3095 domain-containing protein [Pseudochelatococcus sp. B33]
MQPADPGAEGFFSGLPAFSDFAEVLDRSHYTPVPDGWALAVADVVNSTDAIRNGRYRSVNMVGASAIAAVCNALDSHALPYVFGGDGAVVAIAGDMVPDAARALGNLRAWARDEMQLDVRAAIVPLSEIRRHGLDVRIGRYAPGEAVSFATFSGGGAEWAERQMKLGRYGIAAAAAGSRPDLTGLQCRWRPIAPRHGEILSLIVLPGPNAGEGRFERLVSGIIAIAGEEARSGHPVPTGGPLPHLSLASIEREAKAVSRPRWRWAVRIAILAQTLALWPARLLLKAFPAASAHTPASLAVHSDFRKFDDGLKMTIDIDSERSRRIEELLSQANREGIIVHGLHRQQSALMTCFMPASEPQSHVHFIDGADGGYALAAQAISAARDMAPVSGNSCCRGSRSPSS